METDNTWSTNWSVLKAPSKEEEQIVKDCKKDYKSAVDWEANARIWFDYDYKFANGDAHNKYQWPDDILEQRQGSASRPCLTINKTQQHNLQIINDSKQNKPGVRIRPVGGDGSYDAAQIFQEIVYHIEYISNAESVYDAATTWQVEAGIGYWRVNTDYISDDTFDQEIYIRRIKDPRSVYLDPDITEMDGSDARFGIIFEDIPKELFAKQYPDYASVATSTVLGNVGDGWLTNSKIRVAEYYFKTEKKDKLVAYIDPASGQQVIARLSTLNNEGKQLYRETKQEKTSQERDIVTSDIKWVKIASDRVIDEGPWLGKYIPIVRVTGIETVIDGILDRKGHTRALINAQQIYNYNTSSNVEYGALQTKSPYIAPAAAVEGFEEFYKPLALTTPLPTPKGWTTMGEVKIGDWLFDENGKPVQVMGMSAIHLHRKCYRVEFDDGSHIVADEDHVWTIERRFKEYALNAKDWKNYTLPTKELIAGKDYIWCSKPFDLEKKELVIDPYVLGVWLGDGSSASNVIHSGKDDVDELVNNLSNRGYQIGNIRVQKTCAEVTIHGLRNHLSLLGLLGSKHIPEVYLRASYEQRLELLQGLMDTDGHYHVATKRCIFVNINKKIVDGISELLRSLGVKPFTRQYESKAIYANGEIYIGEDNYRVEFSIDHNLRVFKLDRKASAQAKPKKLNERRSKRFRIVAIKEVTSVPVRCVAINSKSHLFLAGIGMIPTHNTGNTINHAWMPYNHIDDNGDPIPPPVRSQAPQASPAYVQQMQIAQNEMMMVSGQYQAQMGENENAKSGVAINARQRQGDRATYHFIDSQAMAIRYTGKIILDLIPKIYDTKRIMQIQAQDGRILNVTIDPNAQQGYQKLEAEKEDRKQKVERILLNPKVGLYDVQADTGPSFATRRMEAFNAMTQIAAQNKDFMNVGGDLYWKVADFPEADILAERWRRVIPPNILGDDAIDPKTEELMHQASDKIQVLTQSVAELTQKVADKEKELTIKAQDLDLRLKEATSREARGDYDAETKRLVALGNSGPAVSVEQIQPVLMELLKGMIENGELRFDGVPGMHNGGTPIEPEEDSVPGVPGSRQAKDGNHYVKGDNGYSRVEMQ